MVMGVFCKTNILNIILLIINIAYITIGSYVWSDFMQFVRETGDHSSGLGLLIEQFALVGIACVLFIPLAIVARYKSRSMSQILYKTNYILFGFITIVVISSVFIWPY